MYPTNWRPALIWINDFLRDEPDDSKPPTIGAERERVIAQVEGTPEAEVPRPGLIDPSIEPKAVGS